MNYELKSFDCNCEVREGSFKDESSPYKGEVARSVGGVGLCNTRNEFCATVKGEPPQQDGGFTLIEIVISLAIISIALVVLLTVFNKTILTAAESSTLTDAVMIAKEKIALVGINGVPETSESEWEDDERYPRYEYRTSISETFIYNLAVYLVEVEVRHNDRTVFTLEKYLKK